MSVLEFITLIVCVVLIFGVDIYLSIKRYKDVKERDKRNADNLERIADYFDSSESEFIGMCNDIENGYTWEELRKKYGRLVIVHFNELQQYRDSYFKYLHESK